MAIEKDIAIKVVGGGDGFEGVDRCIKYATDDHHHDYNSETVMDYAENPDKTTLRNEFIQEDENRIKAEFARKGSLISSISNGELSRRLDAVDFMEQKKKYEKYKAGDRRGMGLVDQGKAKGRDCYHVIQSLNESCADLDPRLVHQIGVEYAKRAFPGYKCVVSTHQNTGHAHNHIVVCAYNEDGMHKLNFDGRFRREIRKINDELCQEYGLHTLDPDLVYNRRNTRYIERKIRERGKKSYKDQVRDVIIEVLNNREELGINSWHDFVDYMQRVKNFEIKQTEKKVTYIKKDLLMKNGEPFHIRDDKLGNFDGKTNSGREVYCDADFFLRRSLCEHCGWDKWQGVNVETGEILEEKEEYSAERDKRIKEKRDKSRAYNNENIFDKDGNLAFTRRFTSTHEEKFFISRWTEYGRRRSDLELIVLAVIHIFKKIKDFFKDVVTDKDKKISIADKEILEKDIKDLSKCLDYLDKYNVSKETDLEGLHQAMKSALQDLTADRTFYGRKTDQEEIVQSQLNALKKLAREAVKLVGSPITADLLKIYEPSRQELAAFRSEREQDGKAVSANQKRKLYQLLNQSGQKYQLKCKFDELNFASADAVIRFLDGKTDKKPDVLASPEEIKADRREKLYRKIFDKLETAKHGEKLSGPISKSLLQELLPFITENGIEIDLSKLTLGQGLGLKEHFKDIPLTDDKTIRKEQIDALERRLADKGLSINRPIEYVTRTEYEELKKYLDTGKGKTPELLSEFKPMSYSTKAQVTDLLEMTGKSLVIPIENISEAQGRILVSNLLYHYYKPEALPQDRNLTPDEIRIKNRDLEQEFTASILKYPTETQDILVKMRNLQIKLYEAGYDIDSGFELQSRITQNKNVLNSLQLKISEITTDFNNVDSLYQAIAQVKKIFYKEDLSQFLSIESLIKDKEQQLEQIKDIEPEKPEVKPIVEQELEPVQERPVEDITGINKEDIIYPVREGHKYTYDILSLHDYADVPEELRTKCKDILVENGASEIRDLGELNDLTMEYFGVPLNIDLFTIYGPLDFTQSIKPELDEHLDAAEIVVIYEDGKPVCTVGRNLDGSYTHLNTEAFLRNDIRAVINKINKGEIEIEEPEIEPEEKELKGWAAYYKKHGLDADIGY